MRRDRFGLVPEPDKSRRAQRASHKRDKAKAEKNETKHKIAFADTFGVFEDPHALTLDQVVDGEERQVTIGMDAFGRVLVVVYAWRGETIRIISARKALKHEVKQYEQ